MKNYADNSMILRGTKWCSPARVCRALLAGSLLYSMPGFIFAGGPEPISIKVDDFAPQSLVVSNLVLNIRSTNGVHQVCPQAADTAHQPFCRNFKSPVLDACGYGDMIYLVLANGDIHRVNNALIGIDGGFAATFHADRQLKLHSAWMPKQNCDIDSELPEVLAIDGKGHVLHFNGKIWRPIGVVIANVRN